jgi:hypothetical protein
MLYREIVIVWCKKTWNMLFGHNKEFFNVKLGGTWSNHKSKNGYNPAKLTFLWKVTSFLFIVWLSRQQQWFGSSVVFLSVCHIFVSVKIIIALNLVMTVLISVLLIWGAVKVRAYIFYIKTISVSLCKCQIIHYSHAGSRVVLPL